MGYAPKSILGNKKKRIQPYGGGDAYEGGGSSEDTSEYILFTDDVGIDFTDDVHMLFVEDD